MDFWSNFWDIFWWTVWVFIFVGFLIVLFRIVVDIFSSRDLSGWGKAGWIVLLVFLPVIGSLIYLIARGPQMAMHEVESDIVDG
jgi:hypothetical protein